MPLAQQLNELAVAHQDGLLGDDEYRLLRQDLFERHSSGSPSVSIASPVHSGYSAPKSETQRRQVEFKPAVPAPEPPRNRPKLSVAAGMASFLRKATGRKPPTASHQRPTLSVDPNPPSNPLKRTFLPRVLSRKSSTDALSVRSSSSVSRNDSLSLSSSRKPSLTSESDTSIPPLSPTRGKFGASKVDISTTFADIFEDGDLHTTKDIRQALIDTEIGGQKIVEAFDGLERSALARVQRQQLHRRPSLSSIRSPTSPTSPSSVFKEKTLKRSASSISNDVASIRSGISITPSRPQTQRSTHNSPYGHHPTRPPLPRQASTSSLASQNTFLSPTRPRGNSHSRSTGHLPLEMLVESEVANPVAAQPDLGSKELSEVSDIRKRRLEVINRYEARLEYLRARLKGAELHEKLMRK